MARGFIDGKAGTTGLRIYDRLSKRDDIELITLPQDKRKDTAARKEAVNASDITFLCLPDDAAREAVSLVENKNVKIIDASTAHRTAEGWNYGFPELSKEFRNRIISSGRTAVPGCHASGFIALVKPLIDSGIIKSDYPFTFFSLTGYSGGGKSMIADYENPHRSVDFDAPRQYATAQLHKHLKEIVSVAGIDSPPVFSPIVAPYYSGMQVSIPMTKRSSGADIQTIAKCYEEHYSGSRFVKFNGVFYENAFLSANELSGYDDMKLAIYGNEERYLLTATYDNLGKGASGAAIQCMNLMLGCDEPEGLVTSGE